MSEPDTDLPAESEGDEVLAQLPSTSEPRGADAADADDVLDDESSTNSDGETD